MVALYNRLKGFNKKRKGDFKTLRNYIVEQTIELVNISGKMVKKPVTPAYYGIGHQPTREETEEQIKENINKAKNIVWKV